LLTTRGAGLRQAALVAFGVAIGSSLLFAMASIPGAVAERYLDKHFADAVATLWAPSSRPSLDQVLRIVEDSAEILDPSHT
jgi:hypothetical protein